MKRLLPLIAMSAMFIAAPAFAQDAVAVDAAAPGQDQMIAELPSTAAVVGGERERINLSDSQLEQLRALHDKYFADTAVKKAQLSVLKNSLRSALMAPTVDRNAVMSLQSQINASQADLNNARISQVLDAQGVFTPEQRKLMHSRMLHHGMGGFRHGHHGWGGGKGGCGGGFGGHHGFGGPGGPGGPGGHHRGFGPGGPGGAHAAMEDGPAPDMTAELPPAEGPDMDGPAE